MEKRMKETAVYIKSKGFTPKTFVGVSEEEQFDMLHDSGILTTTVITKETEQEWQDTFYKINDNFSNEDFGYTTCNLTENQVINEINKVMLCVGDTVLFALLNVENEDWLHRITEYMVYMEQSIATVPGITIYWMILREFFEEGGISRTKSKKLVKFICIKSEVLSYHKYFDEVQTFHETFPYKPLGIKKYHIPDVISLLELYPEGKLNRYMAEIFPELSKTISRELIKALLHEHLQVALSEFKTEELWEKGNSDAIMKFLTDCTIQENKLLKQEILKPENTEYSSIVKQWLHSQKKLIQSLNELQKLKLNLSDKPSELGKVPLKTEHDAKYYALYIRLMEKAGKETPFPRNDNDRFPKAKIEAFAHNRFPGISGQQYYNHYRDLEDLNNKVKIARSYPDLKEIVADIAQNDADVLFLLKDFPGKPN
jgi:hypothetical protein